MRRRYYKEEQRVKYTIRTNQGGGGDQGLCGWRI